MSSYCRGYFSNYSQEEKNPETKIHKHRMRSEHTEIHYKQICPLTAFFPFTYLRVRKNTAKATAHPASQGTRWRGTEQLLCVTATTGETGEGTAGLTPSKQQPQNHTQHMARSSPLEQIPPAATGCQQWILHLHTRESTANNETERAPLFFPQARTPEMRKK